MSAPTTSTLTRSPAQAENADSGRTTHPLDAIVSQWPTCHAGREQSPDNDLPMREYLERIRAGHWSPAIVHVRKVRETKGAKAYKAAKENLPAIAFAGRFSNGLAASSRSGGLIRVNAAPRPRRCAFIRFTRLGVTPV